MPVCPSVCLSVCLCVCLPAIGRILSQLGENILRDTTSYMGHLVLVCTQCANVHISTLLNIVCVCVCMSLCVCTCSMRMCAFE
jgi:hypothetical protein